MGLKKITGLYLNNGSALKALSGFYARTAEGMKSSVSQWLVAPADNMLIPIPERRSYVAEADLWDTSIKEFINGSSSGGTSQSNGCFTLPGKLVNEEGSLTVDQMPIGVRPKYGTLVSVYPSLFGENTADTVDSVTITDSSGVEHEVPSQYWDTCDGTALGSNGYSAGIIAPGFLHFTVLVSSLASILGISITFPARVKVKVSCYPYYVIDLSSCFESNPIINQPKIGKTQVLYYFGVSNQITTNLGLFTDVSAFRRICSKSSDFILCNSGLAHLDGRDTTKSTVEVALVGLIKQNENGLWECTKTFSWATSQQDGEVSLTGTSTDRFLNFPSTTTIPEGQKLVLLYHRGNFPYVDYFKHAD